MTLRHLKIFKEVYEQKSVTRAAEKLYLAQPAVSNALAEIEKQYGVILFQRLSKALLETESGRQLYERACAVLSAFEDFEKNARQANRTDSLRLGTSLSIGTYILPQLLALLKEKFSDTSFSVKIFKTSAIAQLVASGELDFGLVETGVSLSCLKTEKFFGDKLVAVCAPSYPAPKNLTAADLMRHDFILREEGSASRDVFDDYLKKYELTLRPVIESANPQAAAECALSGLGIAILPLSIVEKSVAENKLRIVEIENANFIRSYYLLTHKDKRFTPNQADIYTFCKNYGTSFKNNAHCL